MRRKRFGRSAVVVLAFLSLIFLNLPQVEAQGPSQPKSLPAIPLLLLSETPPPPQPNIAFVTSLTYDGNLEGLAGADGICQSRATAAGLPANTYKAWLSSSAEHAIDRLGAARGWVRVDGKPFADTKADIVAGKIFHPLRVDENGNFDNNIWGSSVWTGTKPDGTVHPTGTCNNWNSPDAGLEGTDGHDDGVSVAFTSTGASSCDSTSRLYCFGVNNNVPVTVNSVAGRKAFITMDAWIPSGGLESADHLCATEASNAGLRVPFKALLAINGATAASRFATSFELPWVRPDGVAIAPTAAGLFSADFINTGIAQSADGLQYLGYYWVWTGAQDPTTAGTLGTTCNNWGSAGSADYAYTGNSGLTYQRNFFGRLQERCNATYIHLYCLQE